MNTNYAFDMANRDLTIDRFLTMASGLDSTGVIPGSAKVVLSDRKEPGNAADYFAMVAEGQHGADWKKKTVDLFGQKYSLEQIVDKLRLLPDKKAPFIVAGHVRLMGKILCDIFTGKDHAFDTLTVTPEQEKRLHWDTNFLHRLTVELSTAEVLQGVIALRESGDYTQEKDVIARNRSERQKLWAESELVVLHNIPVEKAGKLVYVEARDCLKATNVEQAVDEIIEAKGSGRNAKALTRKIINRELERLTNGNPDHILTRALYAIFGNGKDVGGDNQKFVACVNEALNNA